MPEAFVPPEVKPGRPTRRYKRRKPAAGQKKLDPINNQSDQGVQAKVSQLLGSKTSVVDLEEYAAEMQRQLGGAKGVVDKIVNAFNLAHQGTPEQARLLETILKLLERAGARNQITDIDQLSDEDIAAQIRNTFMEMGLGKEEASAVAGQRMERLEWVEHYCI
jgi:hypothetical protein